MKALSIGQKHGNDQDRNGVPSANGDDKPVRVSRHAQEIINMKIEPDEIVSLVQEMAKRHDEGKPTGWEAGAIILARLYPGRPARAHCISERMQCLAEMAKDVRMRGWSFEGPEDGCLITNEAVFRGAALCPMRAGQNRVRFDPDEFFAIVLAETPSEGKA
ncbi:MAG TPA: hypothetical protein VHW09_26950 [Bryobacteraceae bacterium]|jgi:hypothetical protein|nr:hypothetical protein [Bryobacteraceae bacterium]